MKHNKIAYFSLHKMSTVCSAIDQVWLDQTQSCRELTDLSKYFKFEIYIKIGRMKKRFRYTNLNLIEISVELCNLARKLPTKQNLTTKLNMNSLRYEPKITTKPPFHPSSSLFRSKRGPRRNLVNESLAKDRFRKLSLKDMCINKENLTRRRRSNHQTNFTASLDDAYKNASKEIVKCIISQIMRHKYDETLVKNLTVDSTCKEREVQALSFENYCQTYNIDKEKLERNDKKNMKKLQIQYLNWRSNKIIEEDFSEAMGADLSFFNKC